MTQQLIQTGDKAGNVVIEGTEVGKGKVVPFDELLTWSIANAKTISNSYGEIKIDKALDEDRIDPIERNHRRMESSNERGVQAGHK